MTNDDDEPRLSAETFKILQEFLQEQEFRGENTDVVTENWQLSQFWYDKNTTAHLSNAIISLCENFSKVALISCPTLYPEIKSNLANKLSVQLVLFEYDRRFSKYGTDFEFYDYNDPLNVKEDFHGLFDVVVIDPPFLSEECLTKTAQTVNYIKKPNGKIILCTGAIMEDLAAKLLQVQSCSFEPKHSNNLANEFICLTNFGELPLNQSVNSSGNRQK